MSAPVAHSLTPAQVTKRAGSNFSISFLFLERQRRRALTSIYAFCRVIDDAVDDAPSVDVARQHLSYWRDELDRAYGEGEPQTEIGRSLQNAAETYGVRRRDLTEIVAGMEMDLEPARYATLKGLEDYCYKVASCVGLACLPVLGGDPEEHRVYAENLGLGLQLTNILRDLAGDAREGRIYAPQELLREAGFPADQDQQLIWLRGEGPRHIEREEGAVPMLVGALAARAEECLARSLEHLPRPAPSGFLVSEMMGAIYQELLHKVQARTAAGRLLEQRVRLPLRRKLLLVLRTRLRGHR